MRLVAIRDLWIDTEPFSKTREVSSAFYCDIYWAQISLTPSAHITQSSRTRYVIEHRGHFLRTRCHGKLGVRLFRVCNIETASIELFYMTSSVIWRTIIADHRMRGIWPPTPSIHIPQSRGARQDIRHRTSLRRRCHVRLGLRLLRICGI